MALLKHKRKRTNKISKLLHKILDSMKVVYEIAKVLKAIIELFHWLKKQAFPTMPVFLDNFNYLGLFVQKVFILASLIIIYIIL